GRHAEALKTFLGITQQFEGDPRGWAGVGAAHFNLSNFKDSLEAYERCHRLVLNSTSTEHRSHLVEVVHNKARVLFASGDTEKALNEIGTLSSADSSHPAILQLKGELLMSRNDWHRALPLLEAAFKQDPSRSTILGLSACYRMTNRLQDELAILQ